MSEDTDPTTPDDDAHEYDTEPVTLGEAEEALVFALAGVSQIADILSDLLMQQEDSHKYARQLRGCVETIREIEVGAGLSVPQTSPRGRQSGRPSAWLAPSNQTVTPAGERTFKRRRRKRSPPSSAMTS